MGGGEESGGAGICRSSWERDPNGQGIFQLLKLRNSKDFLDHTHAFGKEIRRSHPFEAGEETHSPGMGLGGDDEFKPGEQGPGRVPGHDLPAVGGQLLVGEVPPEQTLRHALLFGGVLQVFAMKFAERKVKFRARIGHILSLACAGADSGELGFKVLLGPVNFLVVIEIMLSTAGAARLEMGEGHRILIICVDRKKGEQAGSKLMHPCNVTGVGIVGPAGQQR